MDYILCSHGRVSVRVCVCDSYSIKVMTRVCVCAHAHAHLVVFIEAGQVKFMGVDDGDMKMFM